jgi:uncharacterized protein
MHTDKPRLVYLIVAALLLFLVHNATADAELNLPALTGRIVDQAGLLDASSRKTLTQKLATLEAKSTDQLVVVTVTSLQGTSIENFALQLFNFWHLGQKDKNNGVLFIVAPSEHKVRIEVGYGLEQRLTNAAASKIIESIIPQFRANDFTSGIAHGVDAIIKALSEPDDAEHAGDEEELGTDRWITRRIGASLAKFVEARRDVSSTSGEKHPRSADIR